jgi:hypothetical protein
MLFRQKKETKPEVFSEETCSSCGEVSTRPFEEGDIVFNVGKNCIKCSSPSTKITAIYGVYPPEDSKD